MLANFINHLQNKQFLTRTEKVKINLLFEELFNQIQGFSMSLITILKIKLLLTEKLKFIVS